MSEDFLKIIRERRSIRSFAKEEIQEDILNKVLEAARWAPSAGNRQPWEFYVIYNHEIKTSLVDAALGQNFLAEAPVVIVVCAFPARSAKRYQERGEKLYCIQDTAAAVQNIMLSAAALGLGSCWIGAFNEEGVRQILNLSLELRPVALIPLGYPANKVDGTINRRPFEEIVHILK